MGFCGDDTERGQISAQVLPAFLFVGQNYFAEVSREIGSTIYGVNALSEDTACQPLAAARR
jgi:hypothetical protein